MRTELENVLFAVFVLVMLAIFLAGCSAFAKPAAAELPHFGVAIAKPWFLDPVYIGGIVLILAALALTGCSTLGQPGATSTRVVAGKTLAGLWAAFTSADILVSKAIINHQIDRATAVKLAELSHTARLALDTADSLRTADALAAAQAAFDQFAKAKAAANITGDAK